MINAQADRTVTVLTIRGTHPAVHCAGRVGIGSGPQEADDEHHIDRSCRIGVCSRSSEHWKQYQSTLI
jgi:hypothetical protein